jgi:hypothetical protein
MRPIAFLLVLALSVPVHAAPLGRGELATWAEMAGTWEGTGTDNGGAFAMTARIASVYEGRYLTIHTTESRGGQTLREQFGIWASGDAGIRLFHYDAATQHQRLPGKPGTSAETLAAGDNVYAMRWQKTPEGLSGARHEFVKHGCDTLQETARWTLKRAQVSRQALRRGDVENFEFFDGELKGDGESAVTPGQMIGAHFTAQEFGTAMLSDKIVVSRQKLTYDAGSVQEAVIVHGVQDGKPFRHVFQERGAVDVFAGAFTDIGMMTFNGKTQIGDMTVTLVITCGGYKLESEWKRPDAPPVWVGTMEMNNVAGSDKAMRR